MINHVITTARMTESGSNTHSAVSDDVVEADDDDDVAADEPPPLNKLFIRAACDGMVCCLPVVTATAFSNS